MLPPIHHTEVTKIKLPNLVASGLILALGLSADALAWQGLERIPAEYSVIEASQIQILNMPRVRNQGAMGICYAFTVQALLDHARCEEKNVEDCRSAEPLSVLDITRFRNDLHPDLDRTDRFNYEGLNLETGGSVARTLLNTLLGGPVVLDKCAPHEQTLINSESYEEVLLANQKFWKGIEELHKDAKNGTKPKSEVIQELVTDSRIVAPERDIEDALEQNSYELFLDKLFVPDKCWDFKNLAPFKKNWEFGIWPYKDGDLKKNSDLQKYEHSLAFIKDLLSKNIPVGVGYCGQPSLKAKSLETCGNFGHSVAITGYRRACTAKDCRDSFKVHNSWGEAWQRDNDDGWVNARTLLDRTFYENEILSWLYQEE